MAENEQGEDPNDAGYLLHELLNANINDHDDDLEAEQREIMPDAAFLRENIEEEEQSESLSKLCNLIIKKNVGKLNFYGF